MKRRLVILANSRKKGGRCIAGIDVETGEWIRPCYGGGTEGIPHAFVSSCGGELLDIIDIWLDDDGPNRVLQPENRTLRMGPEERWQPEELEGLGVLQELFGLWRVVGKATIDDIRKYCEPKGPLLHNTEPKVPLDKLPCFASPGTPMKSLALVSPSGPVIFRHVGQRRWGGNKVTASFVFDGVEYTLPVTDYRIENAFSGSPSQVPQCLLTVSLGLPYESYCYKLVAGVIPLSEGQS